MTAQKPTLDYQWIVTTLITLLVISAGFVYTSGVNAQQQKDTVTQIDTCKKELSETKRDQNEVNKELIEAITDLKIALGELRTELKYIHSQGK